MRAGALTLLAVCEGGGNDTLAAIVVLCVAALYLLAVGSVLRRAEDGVELLILIGILIVSIAIGGFAYGAPGNLNGLGDFLARLVISLLICSGLAFLAANARGIESNRAVLVAIAGDIVIPVGIFIAFFAAFGIGTGCLE